MRIKLPWLKKLFRQNRGAALVEYIILVVLVSIASIAVAGDLMSAIKSIFTTSQETLISQDRTGDPNGPSHCYDPANVGAIGQRDWGECAGMLILDNALVRSADPYGTMASDGNYYTFEDSEFNVFTGQVTDLSSVFEDFGDSMDLNYWNVSNVTTMERMLFDAYADNVEIDQWDTSSLENMAWAFGASAGGYWTGSYLEVDPSGWDTSNVTNMEGAFAHQWLFNADLSNWNTSSVKNMSRMFEGTYEFNRDISGWDVSNVENIEGIFNKVTGYPQGSDSFYQNLSSWCLSSAPSSTSIHDGHPTFISHPDWLPTPGASCP